MLVFGNTTLAYDFNGNMTSATDSFGPATYTWDARNRFTGITATGLAASFQYDPLGRRTNKTINGTVTRFLYDGLNPVQELSASAVTANLLTGVGIDEYLTRTDELICFDRDSKTYYLFELDTKHKKFLPQYEWAFGLSYISGLDMLVYAKPRKGILSAETYDIYGYNFTEDRHVKLISDTGMASAIWFSELDLGLLSRRS